jgi:hypothetical protein
VNRRMKGDDRRSESRAVWFSNRCATGGMRRRRVFPRVSLKDGLSRVAKDFTPLLLIWTVSMDPYARVRVSSRMAPK